MQPTLYSPMACQAAAWSYLLRTIPDILDLLIPLEHEIHQTFIPALTGKPPCLKLEYGLLGLATSAAWWYELSAFVASTKSTASDSGFWKISLIA